MTYMEIKVADFFGDLGALVHKYSPDFFMGPQMIRQDVKKYTLFKREATGSYLLMVSGTGYVGNPYNLIMSVTGPQQPRTKELMGELEKALELETREAPEFLKHRFEMLQKLF